MTRNNKIKTKKIDKLIQKYLSDILIKNYCSKDFFVTVVSVKTAQDLTYAKVFVTSLNDNNYVLKLLNSFSKKIRMELFNKIKLNKIPKLYFLNDL